MGTSLFLLFIFPLAHLSFHPFLVSSLPLSPNPSVALTSPNTLYRTSVPSTLFPGEKVSFKWPSKLENYPPKMHFTFQRCSLLLEEDVFCSTENIPSLMASVYFSSYLSPCSCALFSTFFFLFWWLYCIARIASILVDIQGAEYYSCMVSAIFHGTMF